MKKIIMLLLVLSLTITTTVLPVFGASDDTEIISSTVQLGDSTTVTYFKDGSTITVEIVTQENNTIESRANTNTITTTKNVTYTNNNGEIEWKYVLTGTFSYTPGVSSTCTNATYSEEIYDSSWHFSNGAATRSGNTAYGVGTFKHKVLFVTTATYDIDISLTCDTYGNVN